MVPVLCFVRSRGDRLDFLQRLPSHSWAFSAALLGAVVVSVKGLSAKLIISVNLGRRL